MSDTPKQPRPPSQNSERESKARVLRYLVILFAAAFLLLLLAFLMQQRTNRETISDLAESMSSVQNVVEKNADLTQRVAELEEETQSLQAALEKAAAASEESRQALDLAARRLNALQTLNQLRALYNQGKYQAARELLEQNPALEQTLEEYSSNALSQEARAIYDPLEAYRKLADWLD